MKLREFVRVPRVSDRAKFAVQISKDEAPLPLLTVGFLFIIVHLLCDHLRERERDYIQFVQLLTRISSSVQGEAQEASRHLREEGPLPQAVFFLHPQL